jgi:hypothetical protein
MFENNIINNWSCFISNINKLSQTTIAEFLLSILICKLEMTINKQSNWGYRAWDLYQLFCFNSPLNIASSFFFILYTLFLAIYMFEFIIIIKDIFNYKYTKIMKLKL